MFKEDLKMAMYCRGMSEEAFTSMMRDKEGLSSDRMVQICKFMQLAKPDIFTTKKVGDMKVTMHHTFDETSLIVHTSNPCKIVINTLYNGPIRVTVRYVDCFLECTNSLMEYKSTVELEPLNEMRQTMLEEILIRYFGKLLFGAYIGLRWYRR